MQTLIINEELKNLLPPLSVEEFTGLEESILKDGCLSPLVEWNGTLIDGHHRYEICTKHQIPFAAKSVVLDSLDDAKLWIWKHQENRRNLTPYHRAEISLKLKEAVAAKAKERQLSTLKQNTVPANLPERMESKETRQELADIARVGSRTLAKAEFIKEHADEDTKEKLRRGEKGTSIDKEYKRLKKEEKQETATSVITPFPGETPGFAPGSAEEEKYSPKTQLKPIPRNRPDILVRNLLTHFPKEFVPNMIRSTFQILVEIGEQKQAKALASEIFKTFGRN